MKNKKQYIEIKKKKIFYLYKKNVFTPNLTSKLLIEAIIDNIRYKKKMSIVDLGCGSGIVGLSVAKFLNLKDDLFFSDLSSVAIENVKENLKFFKKKGETRKGSLLSPWGEKKFDIIINDISAISSSVSKISPWFKKIPCESGKDGTDLSLNFLKNLPKNINKNSKVFFPILSLSNEKKVVNFAEKKFKNLKCVSKIYWPLPKSMEKKIKILLKLKEKNYINFKIISGKIICNTSIYMLKF